MNNTNSRYKIGIRGSGAMAEVDNAGLIHFGNSKLLRWVIAGDDRWYDPTADASVRQTTRDGFPIVVTKMRVPTGDVTTLAYCVADHGGVVVFEVRNESTLPFAVVLSDPAWRTVRNPVPMHDEITQAKMLAHVGFPTDAVIHPIGHQASLRFVYGAAGLLSREQIESLPSVDQVASGWEKALSGATRYNLPDHGIVKEANSIRAALLMGVAEQNDIADQVVATTESIRLGEKLNDVELNDSVMHSFVQDRVERVAGVTLATAPVVVSGGRGVGSAEAFAPLEELAGLLGGIVGCSRAVTNNGWRNHTDQVGQTGTRIAPDIYIACGISGAIQHWVGAMASKNILAINTDKEANIVTKAGYAVIGDLHKIVPAISDEIRRRRG